MSNRLLILCVVLLTVPAFAIPVGDLNEDWTEGDGGDLVLHTDLGALTVAALKEQGLLTLPAGIALALGANIGTCVTALLAAIGGMTALQVMVSVLPGARRLLGTTPIGLIDLVIVAAGVLGPLIVNEATKPSPPLDADEETEADAEGAQATEKNTTQEQAA